MMNLKKTMPQMLGLLSLLAISIPAFAADDTDNREDRRPGWGHRGCYNQRDIESQARRFVDQGEQFRHAAERAYGYERLTRVTQRLINAAREFSFQVDRARNCEEIRRDFQRVQDIFSRLESRYQELQRIGNRPDFRLEAEFRQLHFAFRGLQERVQGFDRRPGHPGRPGHPRPGHPLE